MKGSQLVLSLAEYEPAESPEFSDHFHWDAELQSSDFAGHTDFWVSRTHTSELIDQLATLDATLLVQTSWRAGWGDQEHFSLSIAPHGRSGRLVVEARLASPIGESALARTVTGVFGIFPQALSRFRSELADILASPRDGAEICLTSDPDADV